MNYQIVEHPSIEANKLDLQYSLLDKELNGESLVIEDESVYDSVLSNFSEFSESIKRYFRRPEEKGLDSKLTFDMVLNEILGGLDNMIYFTLRRCLNKLDLKEDSESLVTSSIDLNKKDGKFIKLSCTNSSTLEYLNFLLYSENGIESHIEKWIFEIVETGFLQKKIIYPCTMQDNIIFTKHPIENVIDYNDNSFLVISPKAQLFFNTFSKLRSSNSN